MFTISAVIPCFNHGAFLAEAVDSVLAQSREVAEIIVVDDGSTDEATKKLLEGFTRPRTRILRTENRGLPAARNTGINAAKGDLILTLDADDFWDPTFVEKAAPFFEDEQVAAVGSHVRMFGVIEAEIRQTGGTTEDFLTANQCPACALFRRSVWLEVGGYSEDMREGFEDWDFWLKVTRAGYRIAMVQELLFNYRRNAGSMVVQSMRKKPELARAVVRKHRALYEEQVDEVVFRLECALREQSEILELVFERELGLGTLWCDRQRQALLHQLRLDTRVRRALAPLLGQAPNTRELIIFGTGSFAERALLAARELGFTIRCFFDNNQEKQGKQMTDLDIAAPSYIPGAKVLVASTWHREIRLQLLELGFAEDQIIIPL